MCINTVGELKKILENFSDESPIQTWVDDNEGFVESHLSLAKGMYDDMTPSEIKHDVCYIDIGEDGKTLIQSRYGE
jgi:hypothetical protein|tara:strand:+ start:336 stop:563 length:228 start_codon:yes stop_codon:yes gene_type:complete